MPVNVLPKETPRGRGPEPTQLQSSNQKNTQDPPQDKTKEADLAAQEAQELWESQEIGITSWSGAAGSRYSDPN